MFLCDDPVGLSTSIRGPKRLPITPSQELVSVYQHPSEAQNAASWDKASERVSVYQHPSEAQNLPQSLCETVTVSVYQHPSEAQNYWSDYESARLVSVYQHPSEAKNFYTPTSQGSFRISLSTSIRGPKPQYFVDFLRSQGF